MRFGCFVVLRGVRGGNPGALHAGAPCNVSRKAFHNVSRHPPKTPLNPIRREPRRRRSATKSPSARMRFAFFVALRVLRGGNPGALHAGAPCNIPRKVLHGRSEEHTAELQSLMRISSAGLCLQKKTKQSSPT